MRQVTLPEVSPAAAKETADSNSIAKQINEKRQGSPGDIVMAGSPVDVTKSHILVDPMEPKPEWKIQ